MNKLRLSLTDLIKAKQLECGPAEDLNPSWFGTEVHAFLTVLPLRNFVFMIPQILTQQ